MPIFDLGYRHWKGALTASWQRWWPITRTGTVLAWKARGLRWLLIVSCWPLLWLGWGFWLIGYMSDHKQRLGDQWNELLKMIGGPLAKAFLDNPDTMRLTLWSVLFDWQTRFFQISFFVPVLVGFVGATLISRDIRTKAHLVYFSRPISIWHYLLGKGAIVATFIALVTLVPALFLYGLAVAFSPSYSVISQTWMLLPKLFLCFLTIAVPSTLLILLLSTWTRSAAFAIIGWLVIWLMGEMMFASLNHVEELKTKSWPLIFSFTANLRVVCHQILDVPSLLKSIGSQGWEAGDWTRSVTDPHRLAPSVWYLVTVSTGCLLGIVYKLSKLLKA